MMNSSIRPRLLFVSTRFLFPATTGGQIRTGHILRGMKGGKFDITLASPAPENAEHRFHDELTMVADRFVSWPERNKNPLTGISRMRHIFSKYPIPVITDFSAEAKKLLDRELCLSQDIVVFDFPHSAVLAPEVIPVPSVIFTHNVESEIFHRHVNVATDPIKKYIWKNQYKKMMEYERKVLGMFDEVVAVSERDKQAFSSDYSIRNVSVIRTGVDFDYFEYNQPDDGRRIVFTGSMDWMANIDAIEYFQDQIWPLISSEEPDASMTVVGRNPPGYLEEKVNGQKWTFTGFVDDVRPYVREAGIYVIPLRIGGGTRLKVFEAMASGCPVVSTSIGVEGLPLVDGEHYLCADTPEDIAACVLKLINNNELRKNISRNARQYVENNFSYTRTAEEFEEICYRVLHSADRQSAQINTV